MSLPTLLEEEDDENIDVQVNEKWGRGEDDDEREMGKHGHRTVDGGRGGKGRAGRRDGEC